MEDIFKKIQQAREHVVLTQQERDQLDDGVLSFMDDHPIAEPAAVQTNAKPKRASLWRVFSPAAYPRFAYVMATMLVVVSVGGGTVYGAEQSLPGELLYPVKVNVTEEIRSTFTFSEKAKAKWETERVRRRLAEMKELAQRVGAVSEEAVNDVQKSISKHSTDVVKVTESLQAQGDFDGIISVVEGLQDSLETYSDLLSELLEEASGRVDPRIRELLDSVHSTERVAQAAQLDLVFDSEDITRAPIGLTVASTTGFDGKPVLNNNTPYMAFAFPQAESVLEMGALHAVLWDVDIHDGRYMTLQLFTPEDEFVGYIGAHPFRVQSMKWNPQFVFDASGAVRSAEVTPGTYKIRMVVQAQDGFVYAKESAFFRIIKPSETSGVATVRVVSDIGEPLADTYVEVQQDGNVVASGHTTFKGTAAFELPAGTYKVIAEHASFKTTNAEVHVSEESTSFETMTLFPLEISGPDAMVDLEITDISIRERTIYEDTTFHVQYLVQNTGEAGYVGNLNLSFQMPENIKAVGYFTPSYFDSSCGGTVYLDAGETCTMTRQFVVYGPGTFRAQAVVDDENAVAERNEDNNTTPFSFTVQAKQIPFSGRDLTIVNPSADTPVRQGDAILMQWETADNGIAQQPGYIHVIDEAGNYVATVGSVPALFKGTYVWNVPHALEQGMYRLRLGLTNYSKHVYTDSELFELEGATPDDPGLSVTSPSALSKWHVGATANIVWAVENSPALTKTGLHLSLHDTNGTFITKIGSVGQTMGGVHPWPIPEWVDPGSYAVRVYSDSGYEAFGEYFEIAAKKKPSVSVKQFDVSADNVHVGDVIEIAQFTITPTAPVQFKQVFMYCSQPAEGNVLEEVSLVASNGTVLATTNAYSAGGDLVASLSQFTHTLHAPQSFSVMAEVGSTFEDPMICGLKGAGTLFFYDSDGGYINGAVSSLNNGYISKFIAAKEPTSVSATVPDLGIVEIGAGTTETVMHLNVQPVGGAVSFEKMKIVCNHTGTSTPIAFFQLSNATSPSNPVLSQKLAFTEDGKTYATFTGLNYAVDATTNFHVTAQLFENIEAETFSCGIESAQDLTFSDLETGDTLSGDSFSFSGGLKSTISIL